MVVAAAITEPATAAVDHQRRLAAMTAVTAMGAAQPGTNRGAGAEVLVHPAPTVRTAQAATAVKVSRHLYPAHRSFTEVAGVVERDRQDHRDQGAPAEAATAASAKGEP